MAIWNIRTQCIATRLQPNLFKWFMPKYKKNNAFSYPSLNLPKLSKVDLLEPVPQNNYFSYNVNFFKSKQHMLLFNWSQEQIHQSKCRSIYSYGRTSNLRMIQVPVRICKIDIEMELGLWSCYLKTSLFFLGRMGFGARWRDWIHS